MTEKRLIIPSTIRLKKLIIPPTIPLKKIGGESYLLKVQEMC